MRSKWGAEFEVLSETTKQQQLEPTHRLFSLFYRVYKPQDPACLHMLARVCEAVSAVQDSKLVFASCKGDELDRACLQMSRICVATLKTLQFQGCVELMLLKHICPVAASIEAQACICL